MTPRRFRIRTALAIAAIAVLASSSTAHSQRDQQWREDLDALVAGLRANHPNPFHGIPEPEFLEAVAALDSDIPNLTDGQVERELFRLVALISRNGRDGHTMYAPAESRIQLLPLQLYQFSDGLFVIDAGPPHEDLIGNEVRKIGGTKVRRIARALTPYVSKDNDQTVAWLLPNFMTIAPLLASFDFIDSADGGDAVEAVDAISETKPVKLRLRDENGKKEKASVEPVSFADYLEWREFPTLKLPQARDELYLSDSYDPYWFRFLRDSGTLYVRYNQVFARNDAGVRLAKFVKKLKRQLRRKPVDRLVIDLRQNNGGDLTTYEPLLALLRNDADVNQPGKLFAIIDRGVFSAAANFVTDLERQTDFLFVGESIGGSPNHYGDAVPVVLPNFGGRIFVSTIYHQRSDPDDPRLTIDPDIEVELTAADYFAGRDPAMTAILDFDGP